MNIIIITTSSSSCIRGWAIWQNIISRYFFFFRQDYDPQFQSYQFFFMLVFKTLLQESTANLVLGDTTKIILFYLFFKTRTKMQMTNNRTNSI